MYGSDYDDTIIGRNDNDYLNVTKSNSVDYNLNPF